MTLIITSISKYGIAMVADSAVTKKPSIRYEVSYDANKLQYIEYLHAAISMWGMGEMPKSKIATDKWVEDFISRHTDMASLQVFATQLATELQEEIGDIKKAIGMHVAGYIDVDGKQLPVLYHVRNVDGVQNNFRFHRFDESVHHSPHSDIDLSQRSEITRNGDYDTYAKLYEAVESILNQQDRKIPHPSLEGQLRYHATWVRFMSDLLNSANKLRTIGGPVDGITISPDGEINTRKFYRECEE